MNRQSYFNSSGKLRLTVVGLAVVVSGVLTIASAQYSSHYPYSRQPKARTQLPSTAQHIGGFTGNPYRSSGMPPTGLPVSSKRHSYYGGVSSGGSLGYRAPKKQVYSYNPLITSREAGRIEVARGLWNY